MLKTAFVTLAFSFICITTLGQKTTYIGVEAAVNNDIYDIIDNGTLLKQVPIITSYFGLNIRQEIGQAVFLETGLLRKSYHEAIGFNTSSRYTETDAINAWLIPVRFGVRINLLNLQRQQIYLVPVIGYVLGINSDYGYGDGIQSGSERSAHDTLSYNVYSKLSLRKTFPLLQTGLGVEFVFARVLLVNVNANYYTGFKNVIEQNIEYTHNSVTSTASGLSKGEMMSLGLSIKYPISNLWTRPKR